MVCNEADEVKSVHPKGEIYREDEKKSELSRNALKICYQSFAT